MIERTLAEKLRNSFLKYPVISVTGPRQSGKTTLIRDIFSELRYVSLEDADNREFALKDPRGFLKAWPAGSIIDEAQRAPHLFSYLQTAVDETGAAGQYVLSGSQNFLLMEGISQSLAGRVAINYLLPFSLQELAFDGRQLPVDGRKLVAESRKLPADERELAAESRKLEDKGRISQEYSHYIFKGFYPRIYDVGLDPNEWYSNYINTYIERDIRLIKNISDLSAFQQFMRLCAGRCGQILNLSDLGNNCGITHNTAKAWISLLESSFIVYRLQPYYKNFNKRLTKSPKLYFYDPGLVCCLLGIEKESQVHSHYMRGALFETLIMSELIKGRFNRGKRGNIYYWRNKTGREIDCVIDNNGGFIPVEIKSSQTVAEDFFDNLSWFEELSGLPRGSGYIIYGGDSDQPRNKGTVISWRSLAVQAGTP